MAGVGDYIKGGVDDLKRAPGPMILGLLVTGLGTIFTLTLAASMLSVGYNKLLYKVKRGEQAAIGDVFSALNKDAFMIGVPALAFTILSLIIMFAVSPGLGNLVSLAGN